MKILLVEDEHKIAGAIKDGFHDEHYVVEVYHDGEQGLAAASGDEFDVIILDRMLPGMDGLTICTTLRKQGIHTPILMLTAKGQVKDKVDGLNGGADDYMVKPFSFEELLARTRALTRRPDAVKSNVLQVEDLTLDTLSYEVQRNGTAIALSSTEFSLLEYMMRNAGQILSKNTLINHVWDFDADVLPSTVESYINYLRNKVDRPFDGPALIQTVRGFGYKIGAKA